ncbi:ABC transporter ATP-binding protein [Roseinatronobacter sp.]|uniref:ABC transporter ATP-binding protein n=1 Tax=Roseinatronobacter sp. TaxID=1945755 RepID=UPI0025E99575|nr:ABC transporter ATP-binding protein [Roseibaca sp.]
MTAFSTIKTLESGAIKGDATVPGVSQKELSEKSGSPVQGHGAHVQIDGLQHRYKGTAANCLQDLNFKVDAGQIVALVGRSGCGKSTLLHLIAGLMQPSVGGVYINGNRVKSTCPRWVVMFQAPSLFPWMTVAQNAALGLRFAGRTSEIAKRVPALLELVGLTAFADRNVQDLSGGQQQRVALARSLATQPDLLLLDEPFSALDAFTRRALQQDVRRIAKELGLTVVLVTHDITEAAIMADRALIMAPDPGRIVTDTPLAPGPERHRDSPEFEAERARLATLFEATA